MVQDANYLVWVNGGATFDAALVDLVDAPFAIAVRRDAPDAAEEGDGDDFVACGTFGGAVAGDELVIPLRGLNDSGFTGISVLGQGEGEGEAVSSLYLFRDAAEDELAAEAEGTPESDGEAVAAGTPGATGTPEAVEVGETAETDGAEADEGTPDAEEGSEEEETPEAEETAEAEETPEADEPAGGTFITPTPTS